MNRCCRVVSALLLAYAVSAVPALASPASADMAGMSHGRYLGNPDLALTSAMIAAGGGPHAFSSIRLSTMVAAQHHDSEFSSLRARFGTARTRRYFRTFDAFVHGAIAIVTAKNIALPQPSAALAQNPYELAASLRRAGVMADGRFDVGYMIEHLLSRPIHKQLMDVANSDPTIGPAVNADFHIILTAEMNDLKTLYQLPQ